MRRFIALLVLVCFPVVAFAAYTVGDLPYTDIPDDPALALATSMLTEAGVVEGYSDGTFRPNVPINRAEFIKIAMGLKLVDDQGTSGNRCFPDVHMNDWFAPYVCHAKELGIIEGNRRVGVPPDEWRFEPARTVENAEAIKILMHVFGFSIVRSSEDPWYVPYMDAAERKQLLLPGVTAPGVSLMRGHMVQLFARFMAYANDDLDGYLEAVDDLVAATQPISSAPAQEESMAEDVSQMPVSSSSASGVVQELSPSPVVFDDNSDVSVESDYLLLGAASPVMGAAAIFSDLQPFDVTKIVIRLSSAATSIDSFLVYDEHARYLGRATLYAEDDRQYHLAIPDGTIIIPQRKEWSFYVRAMLKSASAGGVSGEIVQVSRLGAEGIGVWNSAQQSEYTSEEYPMYQTARGTITAVDNPGADNNVLIAGNHMRLGSFRFRSQVAPGDGQAAVRVSRLQVQIDTSGGVIISQVFLGVSGINEQHACSIADNVITCEDIPVSFGTIDDLPRILTFYGTIAMPSGNRSTSLRLRLNDPGSLAASAGAVWWTDGSTDFLWLPGHAPLATSTLFN